MVAHRFLVPFVGVRVPVGLPILKKIDNPVFGPKLAAYHFALIQRSAHSDLSSCLFVERAQKWHQIY